MEEPLGFLPRASYFGGLTPNDTGYSNIFAREPWRSPFPAIPGIERILACAGEERVQPASSTMHAGDCLTSAPDTSMASRYRFATWRPTHHRDTPALG